MADMHRSSSILVVDDNNLMRSTVAKALSEIGWNIYQESSGADALALLGRRAIELAVVDLFMPEMDGLELLQRIRREYPKTGVIMMTAHASLQEAVESIKNGAIDFLQKPFSPDHLRAVVRQYFQSSQSREKSLNARGKGELSPVSSNSLIGVCPEILRIKETVAQLWPGDAPVIIQGETGTGKEVLARLIYANSARAAGPFVPVDCAAISSTIMESELFGHVKGAFTGAIEPNIGLIRMADKGSLFLDEIGELALPNQAKLLRTLQQKEVRPVGSEKCYPVDVRVIAATNRDLAEEVRRGNFRRDLFYRLNVMTLTLPPLRNRKEDIPLLLRHFLNIFRNDFSPVCDISPQALEVLSRYDWPGNVREAENLVRRAIALGRNAQIELEDLPFAAPSPAEADSPLSDDPSIAGYEKAAIISAIRKSDGNRKRASEILGIGEATLYRKLRLYQITA